MLTKKNIYIDTHRYNLNLITTKMNCIRKDSLKNQGNTQRSEL